MLGSLSNRISVIYPIKRRLRRYVLIGFIEIAPYYSINIFLLFDLDRGAKYCDRRVCMLIALSVCLLACLETHKFKFYQFFCTRYLWSWLDPPLTTMRYVMYFRFC